MASVNATAFCANVVLPFVTAIFTADVSAGALPKETVTFFAPVCIAASFATTVTLTVFVVLPALTVIVTSPALTPVTTPFASTVAISLSLDVYVTFVFAGFTVAVICSVAPTTTSLAAFTDNAGFLTVIVAFKLVALPFLGVTLTQYLDWNNLWKCDKMWIFP